MHAVSLHGRPRSKHEQDPGIFLLSKQAGPGSDAKHHGGRSAQGASAGAAPPDRNGSQGAAPASAPDDGNAGKRAAGQLKTLDPKVASREAPGAAAPGSSALGGETLPHPGRIEAQMRSPSLRDAEAERCSYARPAGSGAGNPHASPRDPAAARLPPFPALDMSGSHAPASPLRLAASASGAGSPAAARAVPLAYQQARGSPCQGARGCDADMGGASEEEEDVDVGHMRKQAGVERRSPYSDPGAASPAAGGADTAMLGLAGPAAAAAPAEEPDLACHESDPNPNPMEATSPDASEPNELRAAHALCTLLNVQPEAAPEQVAAAGPGTNPAQAGGGTPGGRRSGRNTPVPVSPLAAAAHLRGTPNAKPCMQIPVLPIECWVSETWAHACRAQSRARGAARLGGAARRSAARCRCSLAGRAQCWRPRGAQGQGPRPRPRRWAAGAARACPPARPSRGPCQGWGWGMTQMHAASAARSQARARRRGLRMARARRPAPHPAQRTRRAAQRAAAQTSSRRLLSTVREPGQLCLPQNSRLLHKGKFALGGHTEVYL